MNSAVAGLFYLWSRSFWNHIKSRVLRLRKPKYLLGAAAGFGYLYLILVAPYRSSNQEESPLAVQLQPASFDPTQVFALVLLLGFSLMWLWRRGRSSHTFSEAEIANLFPAPIAHNTLVHFSLLRTIAAIIFTAILITFFSRNWQGVEASSLARFGAIWLVLSVFQLHLVASGFTLTRLLDRGLQQWLRQVLVLMVLLTIFGSIWITDSKLHLPSPGEAGNLLKYLQDTLANTAFYWLLLPFRLVIQPFIDSNLLNWTGALFMLALHYWWALLVDIPNPEGSLERAQLRAKMLEAMSQGNFKLGKQQEKSQPEPFKLFPGKRPELAFLWKNLLSSRSYLRPKTFLLIALIMIGVDIWWDLDRSAKIPLVIVMVMSGICLAAAANTLIMGALLARQDLRGDMRNMDILLTYPLAGWQLLLGSMLTPIAIMSGILWLCLLQFTLVVPGDVEKMLWLTMPLRLSIAGSIAIIIPFIFTIQILMMNAFVVIFPAWSTTSSGIAPQGMDVAGQRMLSFLAQWLILILCLVPAALGGFIAWMLGQWFFGAYAVLPASFIAMLILAGEAAWGINWLGERLESFDLTE